jgi:endonuclease III
MTRLAAILDRLEAAYGPQKSHEPTEPYRLILYRNAGYPQSDVNCAKGYAALKSRIGLSPADILSASTTALRDALREGGIVPEIRARRMKEIAARVEEEFGGDLRSVLTRPITEAKKALKAFPTIGDSGAEKILLFTRAAAIAALPSNCVHVPVRLGFGRTSKTWSTSYRSAQEAVRGELPAECDIYIRAFLLLKRHAAERCKSARPKCDQCVVSSECKYFVTAHTSQSSD